MIRIGLIAFAGLCLCFQLSGCDGRAPIPEVFHTWTQSVDAYLLYVEEVIFPEVICEGESCEMLWRVSAEANPDVLRGLRRERVMKIPIYTIFFGEPRDTYSFDAYITGDGDPGAEVDDLLPVFLPAHPAGEWNIIVRSAAHRSLGGRMYQYALGDTPGPWTPLEDLQETRHTFTVIPRPEE